MSTLTSCVKDQNKFHLLTTSWVWFLFLLIYIIPMGFQDHFQIFTILRYFFSLGAFLYLWKKPSISLSVLILLILFLVKALFYQELGLDYLYLGLLWVIYENWMQEIPENLDKMFNVVSWLFIIITSFMTLVSFRFPLTLNSTIPDRNYAGYFIGFLTIQAYYTRHFRTFPLFLLGILTYSRLFLLSMVIFVIFETIRKLLNQRSISHLFAYFLYWLSQFCSIVIFYLYRWIFAKINYTYQFHEGLSRFTTLFDASNQLRSEVAIMGFESINLVSFFLGLKEGSFAGLSVFSGKTLYPHHTLLVLHVKFGLLTAILYAWHFLMLFRHHFNQTFPFFIWLIIYQLFLGPSIFYGIELLLALLVIQSKEAFANAKC